MLRKGLATSCAVISPSSREVARQVAKTAFVEERCVPAQRQDLACPANRVHREFPVQKPWNAQPRATAPAEVIIKPAVVIDDVTITQARMRIAGHAIPFAMIPFRQALGLNLRECDHRIDIHAALAGTPHPEVELAVFIATVSGAKPPGFTKHTVARHAKLAVMRHAAA